MPPLSDRKDEEIGAAILPWLYERIPDAKEIVLPKPQRLGMGGSSEVYSLKPRIRERGRDRRESWVLRIEATDRRIYPYPSIERQYRVTKALSNCGAVAVPKALWFEDGHRWLGAPFVVMEYIAGQVPAPRHHVEGVLAEVTAAEREEMWCSAIEMLAHIHTVDVGQFLFLMRPDQGETGLDQEMTVWDEYARWSGVPLRPVQERARRWLFDSMPVHRPTGLAWGDARFGNMVFRDRVCVAVLDWETVSLGGAEADLGWWLFFDWMVSEGAGVKRLPGIGGREETLSLWQRCAGRKVRDMEWHEIFATWRYSLISDRARYLMRKMTPQCAPPPDARSPAAERLDMLIGSH